MSTEGENAPHAVEMATQGGNGHMSTLKEVQAIQTFAEDIQDF